MYASDLHSELWDIGFDLFRDRETMKARFIQADVFDPDSPLRDLNGKIDIIFACQFLHLFSWKQQIEAIKKIVDMSRPGTCLLGYQIGRVQSVEVRRPWGMMFYHNVDSFKELWFQIARDTATNWTLDASMVDLSQWGMEKQDYEWMSADSRGLNFIVTRSDKVTGDSLL